MLKWPLFILSLILMGFSFPGMFFRKDEKHLVADNFGLSVKDADGNLSDGVQEAYARVGKSWRILHDIKNISHEWGKNRPKLAVKFLMFLVDILLISVAVLLYLHYT